MTKVDLPGLQEVSEVDEEASPFKRRVAVLVVAITFVGSLIALAEAKAGNREERAARVSQRLSIQGAGDKAAAENQFLFEYDVYARIKLLERERVDARRSGRVSEASRASDVKAAIGAVSPLVADPAYSDDRRPGFWGRRVADQSLEGSAVALEQAAQAQAQDGWGRKGDTYVAILTVLAVSLLLLGLSLTSTEGVRRVFVIPGVVVAAVCMVWAMRVALTGVHDVSNRAIELVAEGDRLMMRMGAEPDEDAARADVGEAIAAYSKAIEVDPHYATGYVRRASAIAIGATPQRLLDTRYFSLVDENALTEVLADLETAYELGPRDDLELLGDLGFYYFAARRYEDAEKLTRQSLALNDELPVLWFNLAVAQLAQGDDAEAERSYRTGMAKTEKRPDPAVLSGARTDLEVLRTLEPQRAETVARFKAFIIGEELRLNDAGDPLPASATLQNVTLEQSGTDLLLNFDYENVSTRGHIATKFSFRPDSSRAWSYDGTMDWQWWLPGDGSGLGWLKAEMGDCPVVGEHRAEIFSGDRLLHTAELTVDPGEFTSATSEVHTLVGARMCRPQTWTVDRGDDYLTITTPDGKVGVTVESFVIDASDIADRANFEDEFIVRRFGDDFDRDRRKDFSFGGARGRSAVFELPDDREMGVSAFFGSDNILRLMRVTWPLEDGPDQANPVLQTLRFTDLPEGDERVSIHDRSGP